VLKEFSVSQKIPRLLKISLPESQQAIPGLEILWPSRQFSAVFDISLSGLQVAAEIPPGQLRLHQNLDLRLKIPGLEDSLPLKARVAQLHPGVVGLTFENGNFANRLVLEQPVKDAILQSSLRELPISALPASMNAPKLWLHGAFDTNVILWDGKALIESENLIWMYDRGATFLQKSWPAIPEAQEYFNTEELFRTSRVKVSMGASWMDRVIRWIDKANQDRHGDLSELLQLLKSQRAH
jgi:hypothetical protein